MKINVLAVFYNTKCIIIGIQSVYTVNIFPICNSFSCRCQYLCLQGARQDRGETAYSESANKPGELGSTVLRLSASHIFMSYLVSTGGACHKQEILNCSFNLDVFLKELWLLLLELLSGYV